MKLLGRSKPNGLLFVGENNVAMNNPSSKMDHLVCFLPGTLALAATNGKPVTKESMRQMDPEDRRDLELAEELTRSCYEMYAQTTIGLAPEIVFWKQGENDDLLRYHQAPTTDISFSEQHRHSVPFDDENDAHTRFKGQFLTKSIENDFAIHQMDGHNLLRPETVESLFVLYHLTKKTIYREWGWRIFQAFEKYCKIPSGGYSSLVFGFN